MARRPTETYGSLMRSIYARFMAEREKAGLADWPITLDAVYEYARKNDLWAPRTLSIRKRFRRDMAQALRENYFKDDHGRKIRRCHAARYRRADENGHVTQEVFWADMLSSPPPPRKHMTVAFQQRRQQIVGDCHQLSNDVDFYNARNPEQTPIRMLWDMTDDLADLEQPTEYRPPLKG